MRIFLVRHGESQFNADHSICMKLPDHEIGLTTLGMEQSQKVGRILNDYLKKTPPPGYNPFVEDFVNSFAKMFLKEEVNHNMKVKLWYSPYKRTRETAQIISGILGDKVIDKKEDILLCEHQLGLFNGLNDEEKKSKFPKEYECYDLQRKVNGKFWARSPMGESSFDVACRINSFITKLKLDEEQGIIDHIIIGHGTTLKVFNMVWMDHSYEWYDNDPTMKNCEVRAMQQSGITIGGVSDLNKFEGCIYEGF